MIENTAFKPAFESATLADVPKLEPGSLHLWWLPLELAPEHHERARSMLSDIQHDRYVRRKSADQKEAYLAGRFFLLNLLAAYTDSAPEDVLLSYSRLNKPYLSNRDLNLHFNFTDTASGGRRHGVFAFCSGLDVGVDVEARTRKTNFQAIAENRFTAAEIDYVTDNGHIDPDKFFTIWTRKEAFGKATGKGVNFQMNQRDLSCGGKGELEFFDELDRAWRLQHLDLGEELIATVVHAGHQKLSLSAFHALEI